MCGRAYNETGIFNKLNKLSFCCVTTIAMTDCFIFYGETPFLEEKTPMHIVYGLVKKWGSEVEKLTILCQDVRLYVLKLHRKNESV